MAGWYNKYIEYHWLYYKYIEYHWLYNKYIEYHWLYNKYIELDWIQCCDSATMNVSYSNNACAGYQNKSPTSLGLLKGWQKLVITGSGGSYNKKQKGEREILK